MVILDYDKFIIQKINGFPVTFRCVLNLMCAASKVTHMLLTYCSTAGPSLVDARILQISLDGTQSIRHVKAKVSSVQSCPAIKVLTKSLIINSAHLRISYTVRRLLALGAEKPGRG